MSEVLFLKAPVCILCVFRLKRVMLPSKEGSTALFIPIKNGLIPRDLFPGFSGEIKMELPVYFQLSLFLYSVLFGFCCGILYNIFCVIRIFFGKSKVFVCVQDVIYFVLCTVGMFLFIYVFNSGEVRVYIILTAVLAALVYHLTAGRLVTGVLKRAVDWIKGFIKNKETNKKT